MNDINKCVEKQNGKDATIEYLEAPKELNETVSEDHHIVSPSKKDSVFDETIESIELLDTYDPLSLTLKEKK